MKKQQVSADLQRVVVETLARLGRAFAERDVDAAVACFTPDGAAYGDDLGEHAHGHEELAFFLAEVFEEPFTMGWEVGEVWARHRGDVLWFVARTEAVLT
ncbi:MAG: nuclear transport factor 2 family protein, partial [Nocardioides sp.]|nr:nuclear transport factor 2 family protein [Nocardioides sp.]